MVPGSERQVFPTPIRGLRGRAWAVVLLVMVVGVPVSVAQEAGRCADANPTKNVYFGDLHTHTSYSFDALSGGTRTTPRDAYAFAKGAPIGLAPYVDGEPTRTAQLRRPLDFLAVTDHSEYLGEVGICMTCADPPGGSPFDCWRYANNSPVCRSLQASAANPMAGGNLSFLLWGAPLSFPDPPRLPFCGDGVRCFAATADAWADVQDAATEANDPCRFTAFAAYEWTGTPGGMNWHRNVIFRNDHVPGLPTSAVDTGPYFDDGTTSATVLWDDLEATCLEETPGCDVLAIPHNSNLSAGGILPVPGSAAEASRQARFEPLAEIHQTKGSSECRWGVGTNDEECGFELKSVLQLVGGPAVLGPVDPDDPAAAPMSAEAQGYPAGNPATGGTFNEFLREILKGGLYLEDEVGVNPYRVGFVGATDTHNATPGAVEEIDYQGQHGVADDTAPERLSRDDPAHGDLENNPGGLTAVWAEENTRDAVFEALRRRETYATSGIRPRVRFFGGWGYPEDLCDRTDFTDVGYRDGVPMGSELGPQSGDGAPRFAVMAMRDPAGDLDSRLQRIQVVKGWLDADGQLHERVYDVTADPADGDWPGEEGYVDLATCEPKPTAPGADTLCTVWEDPDFEAGESAFYYARVLENPTCRWSTRQCLSLGGPEAPCWERLTTPANLEAGQPGVVVGYTIQERAWTSSIWYRPEGS